MNYSQHGEDSIIFNLLKELEFNHPGTLLDIGANDGITYSNSRMFIETLGWGGILIEPTTNCAESLNSLYFDNNNIDVFNVAIAEEDGETTIFLGSLHNEGVNQVSTLNEVEKNYWERNRNVRYESEIVKTSTLKTILSQSKFKSFDIISIDTEGKDLEILKQVVENNLQPLFIIFEYNDNNDVLRNADALLGNGYSKIHTNGINAIYKKL